MAVKTTRKIVNIDEAKCDGCGQCASACVEGAIRIVNGKAKLMSETYCDGLGACLGKCPQDAITIEKRDVLPFNEEAAKEHVHPAVHESFHACPGTAIREIEREETPANRGESEPRQSALRNFPFQLALVPPTAPFLKEADLVLSADCVPFAYAGFHEDFLAGKILLIDCPKLNDFEPHKAKLTEIIKRNNLKSLTVIRMEVPCCSGLTYMAREALKESGKNVPMQEIVVSVRGDIKEGA
jgi:Pyruvate/2-oxoacid:ferredoxin oxidoreductase delta subunit